MKRPIVVPRVRLIVQLTHQPLCQRAGIQLHTAIATDPVYRERCPDAIPSRVQLVQLALRHECPLAD